MGMLDSVPLKVSVVEKEKSSRLESIFESADYKVSQHKYTRNNTCLVGLLRNIAVYANQYSVSISTNGIEGELRTVSLNATNFKGLIDGSYITQVLVLPFSKGAIISNNGSGTSITGTWWRVVVFTNKSQVFHNFPNRVAEGNWTAQEDDAYIFDESVVWDLPSKKNPVKTNEGNDAELISTGAYRYLPALPENVYEMHPAVNADNGFGNNGFPAVYEYTDTGTYKVTKRPRFFFENRDNYEVSPLRWMSGVHQGSQMSIIGTYSDNLTKQCRTVVFLTSDGGRQWFAQYEFGGYDNRITKDAESNDLQIKKASGVYADCSLIWDNNTCGSGIYKLKKRSSYTPSDTHKKITDKFRYDLPVDISNITSSTDGIIVTTSTNHKLNNGDVIVIDKVDDNANAWDWIVSSGYNSTSAGNGVIWKVSDVTANTFKLRYNVYNPDNNISARHIHAINRIKDGYIISCGEGYPAGWILWLKKMQNDNFVTHTAQDTFPIIRLTSSPNSAQRLLGMHLYADGTVLCASDNDTTHTNSITLPNGTSIMRNATGIYKGRIEDIDDFSKFECIHESKETAFFFQRVMGVLIYAGMREEMAISFDEGVTWSDLHLPPNLWATSPIIGITNDKTLGIKHTNQIWNDNTLVIKLKK